MAAWVFRCVSGDPCDVRGPLLALSANGMAVKWSNREPGSAVKVSVCSLTDAKIEDSSRLVLLGETMRRGAVQMMGIVVQCSRCDVSVRAMVSQGCAAVYPNGTTGRKQCWRKPARSLHSCSDLIRAIRSAVTSGGQSATDCAIMPGGRRLAVPNGLDVIPEPG